MLSLNNDVMFFFRIHVVIFSFFKSSSYFTSRLLSLVVFFCKQPATLRHTKNSHMTISFSPEMTEIWYLHIKYVCCLSQESFLFSTKINEFYSKEKTSVLGFYKKTLLKWTHHNSFLHSIQNFISSFYSLWAHTTYDLLIEKWAREGKSLAYGLFHLNYDVCN